MKSQACEPCNKRKVRCDRAQPACSNCKRRKHDNCKYPEITPLERIRKLEALVQRLGGDPDDFTRNVQTSPSLKGVAAITPQSDSGGVVVVNSRDPALLRSDGHSQYIESRAWSTWHGGVKGGEIEQQIGARGPIFGRDKPHAFTHILGGFDQYDFASEHPAPEVVEHLWSIFESSVYPFCHLSFEGVLRSLCNKPATTLFRSEHALRFAIYLLSILASTEDDCQMHFLEARTTLLDRYQSLCEKALCALQFLNIEDLQGLQAMVMYMLAGMHRISWQSLWSLLGLAIRHAERLGVHRDGTLLGLTPFEIEDRRRLWWQLQFLDLYLAIMSGATSLTLMADWDVELPLNIEDEDISPEDTTSPPERPGLVSMSYCRFGWWVLNWQRTHCQSERGRWELSWQSNKDIPHDTKEALISQLEQGLNDNFLKYCDPIKPVHALLQIIARSLISGFRLRSLHPMLFTDGSMTLEHRRALLDAAIKCLDYSIALSTTKNLRKYDWFIHAAFQWHPFMCVLVEASQQDLGQQKRIWTLLEDLYTSDQSLYDFAQDKRRGYAAELVVAAWNARPPVGLDIIRRVKPEYIRKLEGLIGKPDSQANAQPVANQEELGMQYSAEYTATTDLPPSNMYHDNDELFNLDFQDIDWSFWSSL